MDNYKGLAINLFNFAASQYCFYNFNSMCKFGDTCIGANDSGIHVLKGDTDNGTAINAFFELVQSDWKISNYKRIRKAIIGCTADGTIKMTFITDDDDSWSGTFIQNKVAKQCGNAINGRRDILGRYWKVRLENTSGCDFKVDDIELSITVLNKGRNK